MKNILQITEEKVNKRKEVMAGSPLDFVMGRSAELIREAQNAKSDPSRLVLASHFAIELYESMVNAGIQVLAPREVFQGNATSAIIAALRTWEEINKEFEDQLKPQAELPPAGKQ